MAGALSHQYYGTKSAISGLSFVDGSVVGIGRLIYYQGQDITFTWTGDATHTALTGSTWGNNLFKVTAGTSATGAGGYDNTYDVAAGAGPVTLAVGARSNTLLFDSGDGAISVNANYGFGTVKFSAGITAADITFQADDATGSLIILDGHAGDRITVAGDFSHQYYGTQSAITGLSFSDGSSMSVGRFIYYQGQDITFTWSGDASHTALAGSIWGNNNFILGPGTDDIILGPQKNALLFGTGNGQVTADLSGSSTSARSEIDLGAGVSEQNIWLSNQHGDLVAQILGSTDALTIKDWFGTSVGAEVGLLKGADALKLDSQIGTLVSAMATYRSDNPGFSPAGSSAMPLDTTLQNALSAVWHT